MGNAAGAAVVGIGVGGLSAEPVLLRRRCAWADMLALASASASFLALAFGAAAVGATVSGRAGVGCVCFWCVGNAVGIVVGAGVCFGIAVGVCVCTGRVGDVVGDKVGGTDFRVLLALLVFNEASPSPPPL